MMCRKCGFPRLQMQCLLFSEIIVYEFKETGDGLQQKKKMNKIVSQWPKAACGSCGFCATCLIEMQLYLDKSMVHS
jgi:aerobic-type carbon monoxide dehydrogenase small subunit (CoxS/CutS family)